MSLKLRLISLIVCFCTVIGMMITCVFALRRVTVDMGGVIYF